MAKHFGVQSTAYDVGPPITRFDPSDLKQYKTLLQEHADLLTAGDAIIDHARAEDRGKTDSESRQVDDILARLVSVKALIRQHEDHRSGRRTAATPPPRLRGNTLARTYDALFGAPEGLQGWRDADEFWSVVHGARHDERLVPAYAAIANESVPSEGGFSVPAELVAEMLDASLEDEIVRPRADVTPMASETKQVWAFDASTAASATLYGAYTAQWVPEGGAITAQTPLLRKLKLQANKLALLTQTSNELAADGESYGNQLETAMIKAMGWFMDLAFLTGSGAGQPLGILNDPALIVQAKEAGQTADTINYSNLAKMFSRLHPSCVRNSVWIANSTTIPQLLQLSVVVGAGGSFVPVLNQSGTEFTMLTRPVLFTEKLPGIGDQGDIVLADLSQYKVGLRKEMTVERSAHAGFTSDTTYFRGTLRADGQGKWKTAYTPKNGSTLSWAVALEAR